MKEISSILQEKKLKPKISESTSKLDIKNINAKNLDKPIAKEIPNRKLEKLDSNRNNADVIKNLDKPIAKEIPKENAEKIINEINENRRVPDSPEGYRRPYLRKEVKAKIYENAPRDKNGRILDANTGKPIEGTPDIGHKPGHEHWREAKKAFDEKLTQQEFNERMNNPDYYQLEDLHNNRSHKFEDKS